MKQIKFLSVAVAMILVLLTSCLGDGGGNSGSMSAVLGQVEYTNSGKMVVNTGYGTFYSAQLPLDYMPGDWVYISFSYDMDSEENANADANGYIVIQLTQVATVPTAPVYQTDLSMDVALTAEIPLTSAVIGVGYDSYFQYYLGHLLVTSEFEALTDQRNSFSMTFNPSQETTSEGGTNVYNVYIRAVQTLEGKTPKVSTQAAHVYNVEYILDAINTKEKENGASTYGLKFHYVKAIDEETREVEWASNEVIKFAVITTSTN